MTTTLPVPATPESVFTYGAPRLKFGPGASAEIGHDLAELGARRVLLVTDAGLSATGIPQRVAEQMSAFGVSAEVYDGAHVEPTDASMHDAIAHAAERGPWEGFVAVGGGSAIDTAKAVALLTTNPGTLLDYVNPPVGGGRVPTEPLAPVVAVPTTTGTGSESTTICVLDVLDQHVKSGISHPALRPVLAVVDPELTHSQPPGVTAASGMDVLCHALESFTARPYTAYPRKRPAERVPYCGANPIADLFAQQAIRLLAGAFRRAVHDGGDEAARGQMALAATFAGLGFGNAGVHIPHACAYPIAGRVRDFHPPDYPGSEPIVPHGMAVSLTAPEAFRFTFQADPARHLAAAELLAPDAEARGGEADRLPTALVDLMRDVGMPPGCAAVGYRSADLGELVGGAMKQQRLLATSPRPVTEDDLAGILERSLTLW